MIYTNEGDKLQEHLKAANTCKYSSVFINDREWLAWIYGKFKHLDRILCSSFF